MNVGELFVSLGFDVDDAKLKDFNDKIVAGRNEMLKMTAVAAGAVYALSEFLERSVQNGLALRNMTNELGVNAEAVSKWQALVQVTNPALGAQEALESYKKLVEYLRNASLGQGAGALNMLGVNYRAGDEKDPERVIQEIRDAIPGVLKSGRFDRAQLSGFLSQIFGTSGILNALLTPQSQVEGLVAGKYQTQQQIDEAAKLADQVKQVTLQWQQFQDKMTAKWGPTIIAFLQSFERHLEVWIPMIVHVVDELGGLKTIFEALAIYTGVNFFAGFIVSAVNAAKAVGILVAAVRGIPLLGAVLGGGAAGAATAFALGSWYAPKFLDDKFHWAQWVADQVAPVKDWGQILAEQSGPRVEHLLPPAGDTNTIHNTTTQHIHSTADPEDVAKSVVEHLYNSQQSNMNGTGIQLNQGPIY